MSAGQEAVAARRGPSALTIMLALILGLTAIRLVVLSLTFLNLGGDEAQYWAWSRHLAWGYFTKPPLIAWIIAGTTAICGNGEACVRVSSPLLHGATAIVIFFLARRLYDARIGLWSAIVYATLPIVWFSSALITTDVPCIFCWACALLAYDAVLKARAAGRKSDALRMAALTGLAIGVGLLAKYAMIYFPICMIVHGSVSRDARRALLSPLGALIAAVALLVISPNLIWNLHEGFATFRHTAANADWKGQMFNIGKLGAFIASQVGVFGPILFIAFLFGLLNFRRRSAGGETTRLGESDTLLISFSVPILVIIIVQSFISRANANWAAPAYIAATILTVAWLLRPGLPSLRKRRFRMTGQSLINASLAIHLVCGIVLYSVGTIPGAIEFFGLENSFKRVRGWEGFREHITKIARETHYSAIVTDNRLVMAEVIYYGRGTKLPVVIFDLDGVPANQFELKSAYTSALGDPVLLVTARNPSPVIDDFAVAEPLEVYRMREGGEKFTDFHLFRLADFKGSAAG
jgi:Dolichyl-phosphate-mannose-protein mannosyltransferase